MPTPKTFHLLAASRLAFEAELLWHDFVAYYAQLDCILNGIVVFQRGEEVKDELL